MMTRDELLALSLDEREIEAFGGKVTIRSLTVKEAGEIIQIEDEYKSMLVSVSFALIDPKMSIEDLEKLPAKCAEDFNKIILEVM